MESIRVWWKGIHYRSKTEGQWAVFFDYLGITFSYESEPVVLDDGTCYSPDFLLQGVTVSDRVITAEVKAEGFCRDEELCPSARERESWHKVEMYARRRMILLLAGPPRDGPHPLLHPEEGVSPAEEALCSTETQFWFSRGTRFRAKRVAEAADVARRETFGRPA